MFERHLNKIKFNLSTVNLSMCMIYVYRLKQTVIHVVNITERIHLITLRFAQGNACLMTNRPFGWSISNTM